ncbi:Methyltransferase type 11 [Syntrophobotulus glycolicus DSM 8271]|uniref:Methyltransferase type 11 n=1 Tax=Syntrophobotulus glycolicus (strain DSM 8271 / FlGlyR) TaxID=645991 RepID=F0T1P8_SYNGF|nr:class I SAM-dependent methyltransferase [Syntrophobotulus glycolicus]ADY57472.1 Methyltransferase type 11 [Syntrophobotulus glycolicus DSM 8271]
MKQKNSDRLQTFYKWWLPVYKILNIRMRSNYRAALPAILERMAISKETTVLDVGTGTGALAGLLSEYTPNITGIDFSIDMLNQAKITYGQKIDFIHMPAHEIAKFGPESFDLVTSAFCLHDMNNEYRLTVLQEMQRVAAEKVVILDFPKTFNPVIRLIELLEGSFYHDFVQQIDDQLNSVFSMVEEILFSNELIIYICDP